LILKKLHNNEVFWYTLKMIRPEKAKYWIVGFFSIIFASFVVVGVGRGNLSSVVIHLISLTLLIIGLLKEKRWANICVWIIIAGFLFVDLMAMGLSGDARDLMQGYIGVGVFILATIILIYLNIQFGRYIGNKIK